jgi:hypothetical protein
MATASTESFVKRALLHLRKLRAVEEPCACATPPGPLPPYLEDVVRLHHEKGPQSQEFSDRRDELLARFHRVHYEHYCHNAAAGVIEVTPQRPPYDYRGQGHHRGLVRKKGCPHWHYWRETLVATSPDRGFTKLNGILTEYSDLYLLSTYYTDPEDSALCHRILRNGLRDCVDAYEDWLDDDTGNDRELRLEALRERYSQVDKIYTRCAKRRTVTQYSFGMLLGTVFIPLWIALNILGFWGLEVLLRSPEALPERFDIAVYLGCALGGIGAACSVLSRINSNKVRLDFESTRHGPYFWLNPAVQRGVARIVIGCLFGGVVAWVFYAELLLPSWLNNSTGSDGNAGQSTLTLTTEQTRLILTGVAAFAAGFSERLIPDLILRKAQPTGGGDSGQTDGGASRVSSEAFSAR